VVDESSGRERRTKRLMHRLRNMPTTARNSWKRFSLRGLFVLMSICCIVLGLWTVYVNPFRQQARSISALVRVSANLNIEPADGPAWQRWLVTTLLGADSYVKIEDVQLRGPKIDDQVMGELDGLSQLRSLTLEQTQVTDTGFAVLDSMHGLRVLALSYSQISDRGIARLRSLPQLRELRLTGSRITDAAVPELAKLPAVKVLFLRWTDLTDAGAEELRAALPDCAVYHQALAQD
jgi:Leucine-rich repeat (LRR) protein